MDRGSLELLLGQGLSLAEIGRRYGRHESTVAYWLEKHGLNAVHREEHAAKGPLSRDGLQRLVDKGMSIAEIAVHTSRGKATVRHWLRRYGMTTHGALGRRLSPERAAARAAEVQTLVLPCKHHGETEFFLDKRGQYRCKQCRSRAVARRRRRMKQLLVEEAGGACAVCGYSRNVRALHFHHVEPTSKRHEINARGAAMALERLRAEARKCVLLCANCHAEVEAGIVSLTD